MLPLRNRAAFRQQSFDKDELGGLFIPGDADIDLGEVVELEIHFLEEEVRFRIRAMVQWKRASGRRAVPPGIGLTFLTTETAARDQLLAFADGQAVRHLERNTRRLPIVAEARIEFEGSSRVCQTDDISSGGCFLVVDQPPAVGSVVRVKLKDPGALFSWLGLDAVVCWARSGSAQAGVGVRFIVDGERQRRRIDKLLNVLRARVAREVRLEPTKSPSSSLPPASTPPTSSMLPIK